MRRSQELKGSNAGIVRIFTGAYAGPGTSYSGMGILVGRRHVLTCAHVINHALGRKREDRTAPHPQAIVHVDFPVTSTPSNTTARPVAWLEPRFERGDMALLELSADAPPEAGLAILAQVCGMPTADDQLSVFGFPPGNPVGQHVEAKFMAEVGGGWAQLDGVGASGAFVEGGYSGSAVWDRTQDGVIGMLVAKDSDPGVRIAYGIPTSALKRFAPAVPVEVRRVFPRFNTTWTTLAAFTFVMLLLHLLLARRVDALTVVIPWAENAQLANLWGMQFFAFLTPFLYWLLHLHATSFRLHEWWQRVPSFLGQIPASSVGNTRVSAALSLLLLVLLPLYAQAHFIHQFHYGAIAIYPEKFGYKPEELLAAGKRCTTRDTIICTHPMAGLYSLVTAKGGAKGGFWDNAYHYGDSHLKKHQTFFPILQPAIIYMFTVISLALAVFSAVAIARSKPMGLEQSLVDSSAHSTTMC